MCEDDCGCTKYPDEICINGSCTIDKSLYENFTCPNNSNGGVRLSLIEEDNDNVTDNNETACDHTDSNLASCNDTDSNQTLS